MTYLLLFIISILPVVGLMLFIYFMDKYEKEPIKKLVKAFFAGILVAILDILFVTLVVDNTLGLIPGFSETVFFKSFIEAGIPEELFKFVVFMLFIWRDKDFNEYFDGIVYACFIGLGFACIENIGYVFEGGIGTGIGRALLAVPGHFLYGIILGYYLSLAKFEPQKRVRYIITGLLIVMVLHGAWDWIAFNNERLVATGDETNALIAFLCFFFLALGGDVLLWIFNIKLLRKHQKNSLAQAQQAQQDQIPEA